MLIEFNDYIIKKIEPELIKDLVFLFDVVYGSKPTEKELIDRNIYCHGDNKFIGFIAYHKDSG